MPRDRTGEYRFGLRCGGIFKFSLRGGRVVGAGGEGETHTVRAHGVPWTTTLRGLYSDARTTEHTENAILDPADHQCSFLRSRRSLPAVIFALRRRITMSDTRIA